MAKAMVFKDGLTWSENEKEESFGRDIQNGVRVKFWLTRLKCFCQLGLLSVFDLDILSSRV